MTDKPDHRVRLLRLAAIAWLILGGLQLLLYSANHETHQLVFGIVWLLLGASNALIAQRSRTRH